MSDKYSTTDEIRAAYFARKTGLGVHAMTHYPEFDRWLAKRDAEVAALERVAVKIEAVAGGITSSSEAAGYRNGLLRAAQIVRAALADTQGAAPQADALPSGGVDEEKLAEVIAKSRGFGKGWEQIPPLTREAYREIARAVAEWLKGQGR